MSLSSDGNLLYVITTNELDCLNLDDISEKALFGGQFIMQGESVYFAPP